MDILIAVAVIVGLVLVGRRLLRRRRLQKLIANEMSHLGFSPEDFAGLDRNQAIKKIAEAQQSYRETLAARGVDIEDSTPEIGRDIAWSEVVRQVFRVLEFDQAGTTVGLDDTVEAANQISPYGYLLVESPIINQPVNLPVVHRDDFLLATTVFDEPESGGFLEKGELLVTYAPKRTLSDGRMAGSSHALHYVLTPHGTLDRYYDYGNDIHMANPDPEKLFGPFVYDGEIRVQVNSDPQL